MRAVFLSDMTHEDVAERLGRPNVVLVPVGATEQHGPHLPIDTDIRIATEFCRAAAERVADEIAAVVVPPLPFGISEHHMAFPGTLTLRPETFIAAVYDVTHSLVRHGFDRFILVNGHGGNQGAVHVVAQKLRLEAGASHVYFFAEWALAADAYSEVRESAPGGANHACEYETSVYMALAPQRVRFERAVREMPPPVVEGGVADLFTPGPYAWVQGRDMSTSGVEGGPTSATPEKGRVLVDAAVANHAQHPREVDQHTPPQRTGEGASSEGSAPT